jgi:FkbM family methyltransferase
LIVVPDAGPLIYRAGAAARGVAGRGGAVANHGRQFQPTVPGEQSEPRDTLIAMVGDHVFPLRPDTNDAVIYDSVVTRNEYRVAEKLAPDSVVVDIGVHVGTFSYLALTRGASEVYGFEPEPSNYARARENLSPFGKRIRLENRAVWRSDVPAGQLHFWASSDAANTGGGTLIWDTDGPIVDAVQFDSMIDTITEGGRRRISLMKIDCEGAEFPILLTSKRLSLIDRVVGEYHELRAQLPRHVQVPGYEEFSLDMLVALLEREGFTVDTEHQAVAKYGNMGLFFAERRVEPSRGPFDRFLRWARSFGGVMNNG